MSSNDQTPNDATTQPTLTTVLERINAVAGSIADLRNDVNQRFDAVDQRFNAVDGEIASLRKDVERGLRAIERKITYLAKDFLDYRSEIGDLWERVEELEKKAS